MICKSLLLIRPCTTTYSKLVANSKPNVITSNNNSIWAYLKKIEIRSYPGMMTKCRNSRKNSLKIKKSNLTLWKPKLPSDKSKRSQFSTAQTNSYHILMEWLLILRSRLKTMNLKKMTFKSLVSTRKEWRKNVRSKCEPVCKKSTKKKTTV